MKWIVTGLVAASLLFSLCAFGGDGSETVLQLVATLSGVVQDDKDGTPVAQKVKVGANELINLALGRAPDTTPQPNEVLALASQCGEGGTIRMIVFDKNTSGNLATIAVAEDVSVVASSKSIQFVMVMELQSVGGEDNRINNGTLVLAGSFTVNEGICLTKANATAVGVMDVTSTDDVGTERFDVLIPKGKLVTGANLGTLSP
jgi:hypothetical protein